MPLSLQTVTLRLAAVRRVQRAKVTNERNCGNGDLIARVPCSTIRAGRNAESTAFSALAISYKAVEFVIIVRVLPGALPLIPLPAVKQIARTQFSRHAENEPSKAIHPAFDTEEIRG